MLIIGARPPLAKAIGLIAEQPGRSQQVFAGGASGYPRATFGYLIGFIIAAWLVGVLAQLGGDRTPARTVATMLAGTSLIYICGVPWLAAALHVSFSRAMSLGVTPFLAGDALKAAIAAGALPVAWRLVHRRSSDGRLREYEPRAFGRDD